MTDTPADRPPTKSRQTADGEAPRKLSPAAERALAEAEQRRRTAEHKVQPAEVGGREGPDPVRYGDWEKGGIVSDF